MWTWRQQEEVDKTDKSLGSFGAWRLHLRCQTLGAPSPGTNRFFYPFLRGKVLPVEPVGSLLMGSAQSSFPFSNSLHSDLINVW